MRRILIILTAVILFSGVLFAQNNQKLDESLNHKVKDYKDEKAKKGSIYFA